MRYDQTMGDTEKSVKILHVYVFLLSLIAQMSDIYIYIYIFIFIFFFEKEM